MQPHCLHVCIKPAYVICTFSSMLTLSLIMVKWVIKAVDELLSDEHLATAYRRGNTTS